MHMAIEAVIKSYIKIIHIQCDLNEIHFLYLFILKSPPHMAINSFSCLKWNWMNAVVKATVFPLPQYEPTTARTTTTTTTNYC